MNKHKCILCGNKENFASLIKLDNMPASAQKIPTFDQLQDEKGITLELVQCMKCGLVQFNCTAVDYYKDVIRASGSSTTMRDLRTNQYKDFIHFFDLENKKIIEIGCGRGDFLQFLNGFPVDFYGIENNKNLADEARKKGLKVIDGFADNTLSSLAEGPFDAFLSFNFLEHQPNPNSMLKAIYDNLTPEGCGIITVPSLEYILENNGYYELIRDHIAYYTFETLELLCNNNGFKVLKKEIINKDTISFYVKKRSKIDFTKIKQNTDILNKQLNSIINKYNKIAIWGASHQAFTLAATSKLGAKVKYIIDSSEFKQGKFSPSSHIKIVSPDYYFTEPVDAILIVAPGYTNEITKIIKEKYDKNINIYCLKSNQVELIR